MNNNRSRAENAGRRWRKSSFSMSNGDCVEVACLAGCHVCVRDSKTISGPFLRFSPEAWKEFVRDIRLTWRRR